MNPVIIIGGIALLGLLASMMGGPPKKERENGTPEIRASSIKISIT